MKARRTSRMILLGVMLACALVVSKQQIALSAQEEIIVMTYNLKGGGQTEPTEYSMWGDRVDQILDVIAKVNPDILGLQEATVCCESLEQPVHDRLSAMNGMSYVRPIDIDSSALGFHENQIGLYSHFDITEGETWTRGFKHWPVRGSIRTPSGLIIDVIVVHLPSLVIGGENNIETKRLGKILDEYADTPALLIGDMNFNSRVLMSQFTNLIAFEEQLRSLSVLEDAGWIEGAAGRIDQIWLSPALAEIATVETVISDLAPYRPEDPEFLQLLTEASDHLPVVARLVIEY